MNAQLKLLILGGTTEAGGLCRALVDRAEVAATLSLAGRTVQPVIPPLPVRIGGFGGLDGLACYLTSQGVDAVIDATHPFAARIKATAVTACGIANVPLAAFTRIPWIAGPRDRWDNVPDIDAAITSLGVEPRRVFLTTGRLDMACFRAAPQHHYLIRTIDPPDPTSMPPNHQLVQARGPFAVEAEEALMAAARVDVLVTKNSGGTATVGKLVAARNLGVPVIMVERPPAPDRRVFHHLAAVLAWIDDQIARP